MGAKVVGGVGVGGGPPHNPQHPQHSNVHAGGASNQPPSAIGSPGAARARGLPEAPTLGDPSTTFPVVVVDSSSSSSSSYSNDTSSSGAPSDAYGQQQQHHQQQQFSTSHHAQISPSDSITTSSSGEGAHHQLSGASPIPISTGGGGTSTTSSSESGPLSTSPSQQHHDVYVQKSFRSTVNVDIAALRKGPSTMALSPSLNGSNGAIGSDGSPSGVPGGPGSNPSGGSSGGGVGNTGTGAGGVGGAQQGGMGVNLPVEFATPGNASKRIDESLSNPIFNKVEVTIKGKRDNAAYEILTTEQSYCRSLTILNELYRLPLLEACKRGHLPGVSEELVLDIFSRYFVDISRVNFVLLQGLVERFSEWDDRQLLGDLLLDLLPFLKMYTMYTGNYERSMAALAELEAVGAKESSPVATFLAEIHANPMRTVDLRSYLIMPIQRIPRYRLLLEELIKNTSTEHPDYQSLQKALESIKLVAAQIDAAIHEQKNRAKMLEIQDSFFGEKVQIIEAGRVFIKEAEMGKVCRKDVQKRAVWLFNDLFLYAKQLPSSSRYSKHRAFPLKSIRIKDIPDDGKIYKNAIQIASEKKSFVLLANSYEEKAQWMSEFAKSISEQEKTIRAEGTAQTNAVAPVWVPDSEALRCMICGDKFTLMQRRHHCRQCGNVVCSKCSAKKKELPGQGKKRVCDSCYTKPYPDSAAGAAVAAQGQNNGNTTTTGSTTTTTGTSTTTFAMTPTTIPSSAGPLSISSSFSSNNLMNGGGGGGMGGGTSTSPGPHSTAFGTSSPSTPGGTSTSPVPKTSEMFKAAYDYEPPVENPKKKLSFKAGDVMEITIKNDPGWWFAVMGDLKGWVPASFLEPL